MTDPSPKPPAWYRLSRRIFLGIYGSIIVGCLAGGLLLDLVGVVVYRDFRSYTLSGNPFDPSSFPWYEIDSMRLMACVGIAIGCGIGFAVCYVISLLVVGQIFRRGLFSGPFGRVLAAVLAILLEILVIAWFTRLI